MAESSRAEREVAPRLTNEPATEVPDYRVYRLEAHPLPYDRASRRARTVVREVLQKVGVDDGHVDDAELAVGELVANAVSYAAGPYEIRFMIHGEQPLWCEVVDSDDDLVEIPEILEKLHVSEALDCAEGVPQGSGYGLVIVHRLSSGKCEAYPTLLFTTGRSGKAVAFALPESRSQ